MKPPPENEETAGPKARARTAGGRNAQGEGRAARHGPLVRVRLLPLTPLPGRAHGDVTVPSARAPRALRTGRPRARRSGTLPASSRSLRSSSLLKGATGKRTTLRSRSLLRSFDTCLPSVYCAPRAVPGPGHTAVRCTTDFLLPQVLCSSRGNGEQTNKMPDGDTCKNVRVDEGFYFREGGQGRPSFEQRAQARKEAPRRRRGGGDRARDSANTKVLRQKASFTQTTKLLKNM